MIRDGNIFYQLKICSTWLWSKLPLQGRSWSRRDRKNECIQ